MATFLTWLSKKRFPYEPLIRVEVSKSALIHNYNAFKTLSPELKIAPVLKSNAYGHGLAQVAVILENHCHDIPFFIVDSYFEALVLRSAGIKKHIFIIGYTSPQTIAENRLREVSFAVTSLETLKKLSGIESNANIQIKIDTGMRRQGILPEEVDEAISILSESPFVRLIGVCSHLSDAENDDPSFTEAQINIWNHSMAKLKSGFGDLKYKHLIATAGFHFDKDIDDNVARLGLGLYGIKNDMPSMTAMDLKPVLTMKTIITDIKKLKRDETVGYGNSFKADKDMTIATIPAGYYEGVDRRLSNRGYVLVGNEACPIVGRVSMNITVIDISKVTDAKISTPATIISNDAESLCSIKSIARICETVPYEIAVHIPQHLKRVIGE